MYLQKLVVAALVDKVLAALDKVYFDKGIAAENLVERSLQVQIDRQDLMELLGNLLDNAYKYGRYHVAVTAGFDSVDNDPGNGPLFCLCIEDDGPGIDEVLKERVLQRGVRGDDGSASAAEAVTGQGIGLAIVRDIVAAYGGRMMIATGRWQGAEVCIHLPLLDDVP